MGRGLSPPFRVLQGLTGNASLSLEEFAEFVDLCSSLLTDNNFKVRVGTRPVRLVTLMQSACACIKQSCPPSFLQVAQQTLQALSLLVCKEPEAIKPYANSIVPLVVGVDTVNCWVLGADGKHVVGPRGCILWPKRDLRLSYLFCRRNG